MLSRDKAERQDLAKYDAIVENEENLIGRSYDLSESDEMLRDSKTKFMTSIVSFH